MAGAFIQTTPTEYVPGGTGSYYDIDCSALVPAGAVGVEVEIHDNSASYARMFFCHKNGSVDDKYADVYTACMTSQFVGVDANRVFEVKTESTTQLDFYVRGYFTEHYVFRTDQQNVSTATTGSYVDVDASSYCPSAVAVLLNMVSTSAYYGVVHKNGSSDDRTASSDHYYNNGIGEIVGVDASVIFEQKIENAVVDLFIVGYYAPPAGATGCAVVMHTNATDRSISTTGSYQDLAALPAGALYGFYSANATSATEYANWMRANGSSDDLYNTTGSNIYGYTHSVFVIACDGSYLVEQKIEAAYTDTYEIGYGIDEAYTFAKTLTGTVTATGISVTRGAGKVLTGTATATGATVQRGMGRTIAAQSEVVGTITMGYWLSKVLTGTVEVVGTIGRAFLKTVATATSEVVGSVVRGSRRTLAGTAGAEGAVSRATSREILATAGTLPVVVRGVGKLLSATSQAEGTVSFAYTWAKTLVGEVGTVAVLKRDVARSILGTVSAEGAVARHVSRDVVGTVGVEGSVQRAIEKIVGPAVSEVVGTIAYFKTWVEEYAGGVEVVGSIQKLVMRNLAGAVNVVGDFETFLYDIVYAMNQTFRRIYAKVRITYTDPYFSAGVATSADAVGDYTY
ncbi:MAG: hypothetical protein WC565_08775, partial [Parcubacteria group bacterium]